MNKILSFTLGLALCLPLAVNIHAQDKKIINATYMVENDIKSDMDIVKAELDDFDFIYIMAGPKWAAEDFDLPQAEINRKYVQQHEYQHPDLIKKLIATIHETGGKILCSFPGTEFVDIASSVERGKKFAAMMAEFVKKYDYDGIELDWEHTISEDLHLRFMQEIRRELTQLGGDTRRYWLTTALHHYREYTPEQARQLYECVDWINIMFYDMGGGIWGTSPTHNCPLDQIKKAITDTDWKYFPHEKLHIGLACYGFKYKGIKPGETVATGKTLRDYGRYCGSNELPALIEKGWTEEWCEVPQCAYFFSPDKNEFMTVETHRSLDAKIDWVKQNGFGGVFWWEYTYDWIKPTKPGERGTHLLIDYVTSKIK